MELMYQVNQNALAAQVNQFVGEWIAVNMSQATPQEHQDGWLNQPFSNFSEQDSDLLEYLSACDVVR